MNELRLQPGPQRQAAESEARIVLYGGARGGGKSYWSLFDPMANLEDPAYSCTIFRRTYPELTGEGSLWEESLKLYPLMGGEPVASRLEWKFPSGARISFRHCQHETDASKWQGKNLGDVTFDEATFFTETQFWTLIACMRAGGTPPRFRMTCNPDPDSWLLPFVSWYLDQHGFPIRERSGVVRWFKRVNGKLMWFDKEVPESISFTFIASYVWDNPALLNTPAGQSYITFLQSLPPVEQARFLGGNWKIRASSGDYFQRHWFPRLPMLGNRSAFVPVRTWRSWDLAATPVEGCTVPGAPRDVRAEYRPDADWTRGVKFGQDRHGKIAILDVVSCRDAPGAVEWLMKRTAIADGPRCMVVMWLDPAQAGIHQVYTYTKLLRGIARYATCPSMKPHDAAALVSRAVFRGELSVPDNAQGQAPWLDAFFSELEGYRGKETPPEIHDDQVSALALGYAYSLEVPLPGRGRQVLPVDEQPGPAVDPFRVPAHDQFRERARNDVRDPEKIGRFTIR